MKRLFILVIALALMPFASINAQDARNRVTTTIVADAMAQLPAKDQKIYNQTMDELAKTGAEGMQMMASMLRPAAEGVNNSAIEYAINGVAAYVSKGQESLRGGVREGLKKAIEKCSDNPTKAFLMTALQICATAEDGTFYAEKLSDAYLGNFAARALASIKGTEPLVAELIKAQAQNGYSKVLLAQIASYKNIPEVEPALLAWLSTATPEERCQINLALATCGGEKALKVLAAQAKAVDYSFESTDAYGAYSALLTRMVKENPAAAEKAAKKLMKEDKTNVRLTGLDLLILLNGAETTPLVVKALSDDCRQYRYGAMRAAEAYADEATYAAVAALLPKASNDVKIDIINWLGANHVESQIDAVVAQIANPENAVAVEAMEAASRIGGEKALEGILAKVESLPNTENTEIMDTAIRTLLSFNGKVNSGIVKALDGNNQSKVVALGVLLKRSIPEAAEKVIAMAKAGNDMAQKALPQVASEKNFDAICDLFETGRGEAKAVNKAIENKPAAEQVKLIEARMAKAKNPSAYIQVLANTNADEAVATIVNSYKSSTGAAKDAAFNGLLSLNKDSIIPVMYEIATTNAPLKDKALSKYITLTAASKLNAERKYKNYSNVLAAEPSLAVKNAALKNLSATQTYQAMMLAAEYMDNAETAQAAANTVLQIATKHPEFYSAEVKALLEKVSATLNDGDAVYKRKDIEKFINENKARESHSIIKELSAEEKAEGFELLFDGKNMDSWTGNLDAYQPVDGYMYVTAAYGSTGNLYTKKEYADFVLRFEFCFDREGVNNGIGIRTPMGVDAAYHGMEIQVLHHDAPIYAGLREYQVHGSVYGIIPAKRIKWGALGEWHSEEIRIKGDNIKVTVDGEVILEGNIRKACKGHNVNPKGEGPNPYTVDHLNHPGLFNKKGHIGLLGHGEGIKYRNIRVKEL